VIHGRMGGLCCGYICSLVRVTLLNEGSFPTHELCDHVFSLGELLAFCLIVVAVVVYISTSKTDINTIVLHTFTSAPFIFPRRGLLIWDRMAFS